MTGTSPHPAGMTTARVAARPTLLAASNEPLGCSGMSNPRPGTLVRVGATPFRRGGCPHRINVRRLRRLSSGGSVPAGDQVLQSTRNVPCPHRGGRTVRFSNDPQTSIPPADRAWDGTRVLYLQHASDPIVWWSPRLIAHRPDWLDEPRGDDVVTAMHWIPLVTFWQVSADLPFATEVPTGHGHVYTREYVDAWAHVLQPPGWAQHNAEVLRAIIAPPS